MTVTKHSQNTADTTAAYRRGPNLLARISATPELGVFAGLVLIVAIFCIMEPNRFATVSNINNLLADSAVLSIVAVATTFMIISRNLDLSIGGIIAFCEVIAAKSMTYDGGWLASGFGLGVALTAGLAWGLFNALLVTRVRVPPFVATLATLGIAQGAAYVLSRGVDISTVPIDLVMTVGVGDLFGVPVMVYIAAAVVAIAALFLSKSRFGRHTYAIGSDPTAAERAGVSVRSQTFKIYILAGAAYGLVAWLNLARFSSTLIGGHTNDALNAITAVVLGGTSLFGGIGSIFGTVIGVFIPSVLRNGLIITGIQPFWQQIAVGIALALAVGFDQYRRNRSR